MHEIIDLRNGERFPGAAAATAASLASGGAHRDASKYGKRHRAGEMNGTESKYAHLLAIRQRAGEIVDWLFEAVTFRLADRSRYTPDFMVLHLDKSIEFVNVKGGGPIDPNSLTKHKFAAEKFWMYRWTIEQLVKGTGWQRTEFESPTHGGL